MEKGTKWEHGLPQVSSSVHKILKSVINYIKLELGVCRRPQSNHPDTKRNTAKTWTLSNQYCKNKYSKEASCNKKAKLLKTWSVGELPRVSLIAINQELSWRQRKRRMDTWQTDVSKQHTLAGWDGSHLQSALRMLRQEHCCEFQAQKYRLSSSLA